MPGWIETLVGVVGKVGGPLIKWGKGIRERRQAKRAPEEVRPFPLQEHKDQTREKREGGSETH